MFRPDPSTLSSRMDPLGWKGRPSEWHQLFLDQRLSLTAHPRGRCWQLRGNLGRWCGPRMNLGYFPNETLARQFGNNLGLGIVQSGLAHWWTPLDIWRAAISESIRWEDGKLRTPLEFL